MTSMHPRIMKTTMSSPSAAIPRTRPISMNYLRAFDAVARHLNFRMAAEELALTQSAVSRQIQSLEHEVGTALFLRHTRSVELTSAGGLLLRAVGTWPCVMPCRTPPPRASSACLANN